MNDFVNNRIRLGKIIEISNVGSQISIENQEEPAGIPIYSPKEGIYNI